MDTTATPASTSATDARPARERQHYLDNLKVALITLVVLHHAAQPYGPTDWWYVPGDGRSGVLNSFTVVNGSFFMALFFAISAYLVPAAYDGKGGRRFLSGRLKRLGTPFVSGTLTVIPVLTYIYYRTGRDYPAISFPRYYADVYLGLGGRPVDWTGPTWPDLQFGHLWFIEHLLVYAILYSVWRALTARRHTQPKPRPTTPIGHAPVLGLAVLVTGLTAALRVFFPVDQWYAVLDFIQVELADVGQYAALFVVGLLAYRRGWLARVPARTGYTWLVIGAVLAAVYYAGAGALSPHFAGGGASLRQLVWSAYESTMCVALCVGLTVLFRERFNGANRYGRMLAADSFAVYVIHVLFVVALQLAMQPVQLPPLAKFAIVGPAALAASFLAGHWLRKLPGVRSVL